MSTNTEKMKKTIIFDSRKTAIAPITNTEAIYLGDTETLLSTIISNDGKIDKSVVGLDKVENRADAEKKVAEADKLTTARRISLSGTVSGYADFDGSANISITTAGSVATPNDPDDSENNGSDGLMSADDKRKLDGIGRVGVETIMSSYTLGVGDIGKVIKCNNTNDISITIPSSTENVFKYAEFAFIKVNAGKIQISPEPNVTINGTGDSHEIVDIEYSTISIKNLGNNDWVIIGEFI